MEPESQPAASNAAVPPSELTAEELADELAVAQARAHENHQKHLYAMAELDNARKRMEKQLADRLTAGRKELLAKFLPVIDNLHRALAFEIASDSLRNGLQATL